MVPATRQPLVEPFEPADLADVLRLWKASIGGVFPLSDQVLARRLGLGVAERPSVVAVCARLGDRLVGFGYLTTDDRAVSGSRHMRLQAVVVDPDHRRRGIGSTLARSLLDAGSRAGATSADVGGGLDYLWPGVPDELPGAMKFVRTLGFRPTGTSYDLRGTAASSALAAAAASGLETTPARVRPAHRDDLDTVLAFVGAEFEPDWRVDLQDDIEDGLEPRGILLATDVDGQLVAYARLHTLDARPIGPPLFWAGRRGPDAGGLGPIGVARAWRGRGLGTAFLGSALVELAGRGATDVVIDFTDRLDFYGRLGFVTWMTFRQAALDVSAGQQRPDA
jgi:GNAT superfamily N-acetyltransferase